MILYLFIDSVYIYGAAITRDSYNVLLILHNIHGLWYVDILWLIDDIRWLLWKLVDHEPFIVYQAETLTCLWNLRTF